MNDIANFVAGTVIGNRLHGIGPVETGGREFREGAGAGGGGPQSSVLPSLLASGRLLALMEMLHQAGK
ncbi:hypothetical protein B9N43_06000 [Denitratisoma sp. DHT3]|nr:hypothetical protein B9N43_06000 [Denitratisoma sp. DHT3]